MSQAPGPGDLVDLPIRTVPDWLTPPARGGPPREPWYYGFLEKYARVLLVFGLVTFSAFALAFVALLLFPEVVLPIGQLVVAPLFRGALADPGVVPGAAASPSFVGRLVLALAVLGAGFFGFLLPVLLSVAYILLSVDAGRNLRAMRGGRPGVRE